MSEEVTMKDLLVAINELSADNKEIKQKLGNIEARVGNIETRLERVESEVTSMRTELKADIRRVDKKFELVLKDLYETKTDVSLLQKGNY